MRKTLPLEDHEVVLTFDDGPLPKYSDQILDILAAHCAKATFFLVGRQANDNPEGVRKVRDAGHTVATHSQNHPTGMDRLPLDRARQEIEQGIASVTAALADGTAPAPFFRIPGLRAQRRDRGICRVQGTSGLERRFSRRRLAQRFRRARLRARDPAAGGQGQRHPAAARHSAAHGRRAAENPARIEGARLSHRPRGAGDAGTAGDADRAAAMAVASAVGDGGDLALAENSEIRVCQHRPRSPPRLCPISTGATPICAHVRSGARRGVPLPRQRRGRGK